MSELVKTGPKSLDLVKLFPVGLDNVDDVTSSEHLHGVLPSPRQTVARKDALAPVDGPVKMPNLKNREEGNTARSIATQADVGLENTQGTLTATAAAPKRHGFTPNKTGSIEL
ncbi:hypothetical protein PspLS_10126 [Pyricularia sp. CBS 133598]|nr:hypothetical protein PspLS_10126 [Pyricularia sp. CBS 133598]